MRRGKLLPFLGLLLMIWLLRQITTTENFDVHPQGITPKHQATPTLFNDVGLPRGKSGWCDRTAAPCERNAKSCTPCSGGPEGKCLDNGCGAGGGWHNSVSRDCTGPWASHEPDGTWRVYKHPAYYGYGTCGGNSYGEPYYARKVEY